MLLAYRTELHGAEANQHKETKKNEWETKNKTNKKTYEKQKPPNKTERNKGMGKKDKTKLSFLFVFC